MSQANPDEFVSRFDAQPTRWSMIQKAHGQSIASGNDARQFLVMRYSSAIRGYVRAMTRDEDLADELTQDVIVRLLKGDFAGADPKKGRFRDLLKTAVRNMTKNHWAKQKVRKSAEYDVEQIEDAAGDTGYAVWDESWRKQILDLAWGQLRTYQESHAGSVAYTILKLRTDFPDDSSEGLAERLSRQIDQPVRADQARQQLRRSRLRFAELLVAEVADCLDVATPDSIEDELAQIGLLERIRDVLPPNWASNAAE